MGPRGEGRGPGGVNLKEGQPSITELISRVGSSSRSPLGIPLPLQELCKRGLGVLCPQDRDRSIYPLAPSLLGQGLLCGVLAPFFSKCEHVSDSLNRLLQPWVRERETLLAVQAGAAQSRLSTSRAGCCSNGWRSKGGTEEVRPPGRGVRTCTVPVPLPSVVSCMCSGSG